MDKIKSGIYCIENTITHKKYIGQSLDIKDRWRRHISELNNGNHHNDYLQKAWIKYGQDIFEFYVLEYCEDNILDDREIYFINYYNTLNRDCGYNLKSGGQNGGSKLSKESKEKLIESVKQSYNDELKEKRKNDAIQQWSDPEKRQILIKNNGMTNKHHSEETKRKISEKRIHRTNKKGTSTQVLCLELNRIFKNTSVAAKEMFLAQGNIYDVCSGKRKTCGGYHWQFIDKKENENIIGE